MNQKLLQMARDELGKVLLKQKNVQAALKNVPDGSLQILLSKGKYPQYYLYNENGGAHVREYISCKRMNLISALAQKQYDLELLNYLEKQAKCIDKFIDNYESLDDACIYADYLETRKRLVAEHDLTDDEYVREWLSTTPGDMNSYPKTSTYLTESGEKVRSKSEKIIADMFFHKKIPYVYEPELFFDDGSCVIPDFAALNVRDRKVFFYEHFGMMGVREYSEGMVEKIRRYEENGYWFGENLLYSFESSETYLDIRTIENMINKFLL